MERKNIQEEQIDKYSNCGIILQEQVGNHNLHSHNIDSQILKEAFAATVKKRGTEHIVANYKEIIETVSKSSVMKDQWTRYQKEFEYAKDISFENTCKAVNDLIAGIEE